MSNNNSKNNVQNYDQLWQVAHSCPWRIQDFPEAGEGATPKMGIFLKLFAENCVKMIEFGPRG